MTNSLQESQWPLRRRITLQGRLRYLGLLPVPAHQCPQSYRTILCRPLPSRGS
jgi:hypothetical protein